MDTLIIDQHDSSLSYDNACLILRTPSAGPRAVPLLHLQRVICLHPASVDTQLLARLQQQHIDFISLNARHSDSSFSLYATHTLDAARRCLQYRLIEHPLLRLPLARALVCSKIRQTLRHTRAAAGSDLHQHLRQLHEAAALAGDADTLLGIEGRAQKHAFAHWRTLLPASLEFHERLRRPPPDPVNAVLSLGFTLAYHEAARQCLRHGLDPWLGIYHMLAPGRLSLACDLMEPLRPAIEAWTVHLFATSTLHAQHFGHQNGACMLGKQGRQLYYDAWHRQLPLWSRRLGAAAGLLARWIDARLPPPPQVSETPCPSASASTL